MGFNSGFKGLTWSLFIMADIGNKIIQIQFNYCLLRADSTA